jgi:hypothetical protein
VASLPTLCNPAPGGYEEYEEEHRVHAIGLITQNLAFDAYGNLAESTVRELHSLGKNEWLQRARFLVRE